MNKYLNKTDFVQQPAPITGESRFLHGTSEERYRMPVSY